MLINKEEIVLKLLELKKKHELNLKKIEKIKYGKTRMATKLHYEKLQKLH